jgi:hypothetical protein
MARTIPDEAKTIPDEKAKQGRTGTHILIVLVVGLILASIVWLGVEIYGDAIDPTPANLEQKAS